MIVDDAFYRQHYAWHLGTNEPARHYELEGRALGLKPNPEYDPLVAAIGFSGLSEDRAAAAIGKRGLEYHMRALAREVFARIEHADTFDWRFYDTQIEKDHFKRPASTLAAWDRIDKAGEIAFAAHGKNYRIAKRPPDYWRQLITSGEPCLRPRVPHGFVDIMGRLATMRPIIRDLWGDVLDTDDKVERLAVRILKVQYPKSPVLIENFIHEMLQILVTEGPTSSVCLAFKAHPDEPDCLFGTCEPSNVRFEAATEFISHIFPDGHVFEDGIAWKRYAATGSIASLIDAMRAKKVVLIANAGFAKLGERWNLPDFHLVGIPPANSQSIRHDLLERLVKELDDLGVGRTDCPPAVVLTQAGGSLSFWLLHQVSRRLPHAAYFDVGQAINIWFMDDPPTAKPEMLWLQDFWERIFEANDLFDFYDQQLDTEDSRTYFRETFFNGKLLRGLPVQGGDFDFAWRLMHLGLQERALEFAERAHAKAPNAVPPIVLLTRLYRSFGRKEEARAVCQKGLALDPSHEALRELDAALRPSWW